MDRAKFFAGIRSPLFNGSMSTTQVDGITAILDENGKSPLDPRCFSYVLATAYHESAHTMQPVRETLATSDDQAAARLESSWKAGKLSWVKTPYWRKDADGKYWFGRGLVQITFKTNYLKIGTAIGVDLVGDPDKALDLDVAIEVLFTGMTKGLFSGKKLADYFTATMTDFEGARHIVNGSDRAALIAGYAKTILAAYESAR